MPIVKKRNQQTETRLLLESDEPVQLPPAEIAEEAVLVQFEKFKPYVPELLATLRAGALAEPVPVMLDGSTFAVHGETRTFWVKLWHTNGSDMTRIERAQVISCLPSARGVQVVFKDENDDDDDFEADAEDDDAAATASDEDQATEDDSAADDGEA